MTKTSSVVSLRHLAWPGQLLAWAMILFPLSSVLLAWLTPGPAGTAGRVRDLSLLVDTLLEPLVGIFLGVFLAEFFQQRGLRRVYSVLSGLMGIAILAMTPLFALDTIQLRRGVRPEMHRLYDLNSARALLLFVAIGAILLTLAVVVWRGLRRDRPDAATQPGLVGSATAARV